ncbi:MAG: Stf0 family sulfotransferase [Methylococcaceae bacterium]
MNEITNIFNNQKLDITKLEKIEALPEPKYRYIIAITPRSGSSYLSDVMTHTENLGSPAELLSQTVISNVLKTISGRNPDDYLRNAMRLRKSRNSVAGLKASWFQFRNFKDCVTDKNYLVDFKYIYLIRRDLNAQAVSLYRATASNVFHTNIKHSEEAINKLNALEYDFNEIKKWHKHIVDQEQGWQKFFYENSIVPLCIFYEDIEADILAVLKRIAHYIGVSADSIALPEKTSVFEKVSDNRNIEWTHHFALDYALQKNNTPSRLISFDIPKKDEKATRLEDSGQFYLYGFPQEVSLKTPLVQNLTKTFLTVANCFATKAFLNMADKTLYGSLYQDCQLINNATFRGPTGHHFGDPQEISIDRVTKAELIKGKSIYLGWLLNHFGHILLEAPARFWILDTVDIKDCNFVFHPLGRYPTLVNILKIEFARALFESFGIASDKIILLDKDFVFEELIIPSSLSFLNLTMDSYQLSIYDRVNNYLELQQINRLAAVNSVDTLPKKKKLYLSRESLADNKRKAVNEAMIEQLFQKHDFEVVYLEKLNLDMQIQLIQQADVIAGCDGSALHLGIYLKPDAKIIVLSARNIIVNQLIVGALRNVKTHIIYARTNHANMGWRDQWEADIDYIEQCVNQLLL